MNRDIVVLVPGPYGLEVCDLGNLLDRLMDDDYDDFDAVIGDAAIDNFDGSDEHFARIREANSTGDWHKYWGHPAPQKEPT